MSVDRALEGWEGVQRQGQDIADRFSSLAQGLGCMLESHIRSSGIPLQPLNLPLTPSAESACSEQPSSELAWPWTAKPRRRAQARLNRVQFNGRRRTCAFVDDGAAEDKFLVGHGTGGGIQELGQRLGQAGADLGACVGGFVREAVKHLFWPFQAETQPQSIPPPRQTQSAVTLEFQGDYIEWKEVDEVGTSENKGRVAVGGAWHRLGNGRHRREDEGSRSSQEAGEDQNVSNEEVFAFFPKPHGQMQRQGSVSVTTTFDSRTQDVESSIVARGDLWRAEASHGGNTAANGSSPLFLLQIGPILFVRDTTLLLPIHLSKQHLMWYGFDRKNGLHSLCPAVWSKHRRWLFMSMICLNPFTCSFMDLQFPNGQCTFVAGEGFTSSAFLPVFGGLLQAQSRQPGDTKISFSKKVSWGTRITPAVQLPEKSFSLGVMQPLAWQRSGVIVRPTVQLSVTPTVGGRNAGWRAELIHSPKEKLSWACGCALTIQPTAFASISLGRAKQNGSHSGSSGVTLQVETPMENINRASFSIQLTSGVEF